eukprot:768683-Hanusia_phi.AAC.12
MFLEHFKFLRNNCKALDPTPQSLGSIFTTDERAAMGQQLTYSSAHRPSCRCLHSFIGWSAGSGPSQQLPAIQVTEGRD